MQILLKPKKNKCYIATIAIGEKYFTAWEEFCKANWLKYCRKYDIGLIIFTEDLISKDHEKWKKPTWQKLLIGEKIISYSIDAELVCYIDTDVLISPLAENIFENYGGEKFGLISKRKNLPFDLDNTLRRIAHLRHNFYSKSYPLDSALFITLKDLYITHNLTPQPDEACMGVILFNIKHHSEIMSKWFHLYDRNVLSITNGGDQTHLNYLIQAHSNPEWLPYHFQAIWVYEMATYYPYLYYPENKSSQSLIKKCIEATLIRSSFLHFAGSWPESEMWKIDLQYEGSDTEAELIKFSKYMEMQVSGKSVGFIKPTDN
jgi:hypothetical protein